MENNNVKLISTGLSDEKAQDILDSVIGQMSDGIWENSSRMNRYWQYADIVKNGSEINIQISDIHNYENGFKGKSDDEIKKFFAQKIKQIVKEEGLNWNRNNEEESCYLDRNSGVTVKDAYRVYDKLLGRKERIPVSEANEPALTEGIEEISKDLCANKDTFKYQMLSRLQSDCEYFLKAGNRDPHVLWAKNVNDHIKLMKDLYNSFGEYDKPEWLTMDDIENYAKEMETSELPSTVDGTATKEIEDQLDRTRNRVNEDIASTPEEHVLNQTKTVLKERGIDIDLMHETCSELGLANQMRMVIHDILSEIDFFVNEYTYEQDFDFTLSNKLELSIDMLENLDEDKDNEINTTIKITPVERKILDAVKTVNSKYDLSNIKLETTPDGATHIMSTKGEDIVTIKPLSDDEKEELRLNGYYM